MYDKAGMYRDLIEDELARLLPKPDPNSLKASVCDAMRYSLLSGGKRVRPTLTLAFCELCGGELKSAVRFACAVEMVHTYSLIHDDMPCMDDDDLRRGKPTNHRVFGEDIALLAGDGLLTLAFETLLSAEDKPAAAKAGEILAKCAGYKGMVGGQCIDLSLEGTEADVSLLYEMDYGKTVELISAACRMGCCAAHAGEKDLAAARKYAEGLGMAFQIRDDILDVCGDVNKLGKNTGADDAHDKRNYVSLLGIKRAQELVCDYTDEAIAALGEFRGDSTFLREFAEELVRREV